MLFFSLSAHSGDFSLSAEAEVAALGITAAQNHTVDGIDFEIFEGKPVVLFLSMVNAAMTTQLALGRRLINRIQIRAAADLTVRGSWRGAFSKRVATALECLNLLKKRSMSWR
jgi:hypothetical protein